MAPANLGIARCLTQEAESLRPVCGRKEELEALEAALLASDRPRVLLVGAPGSGREALVEGLAARWSLQSRNAEPPRTLYSVNVRRLGAGTVQADEELRSLLDTCVSNPRAVLFIDRVWPLLKPAGELNDQQRLLMDAVRDRTIASLCGMYQSDFDPPQSRAALIEWDHIVRLPEMDEIEARAALDEFAYILSDAYDARIGEEAIHAAVQLSEHFIQDRELPGKAIELLESAVKRYLRKQQQKESPSPFMDPKTMHRLGAEVLPHDVKRTLSETNSISFDEIDQEHWRWRLNAKLRAAFHGHTRVIDELSGVMANIRSRYRTKVLPRTSILLAGPRGSGRRPAAQALAMAMRGADYTPIEFDLASAEPNAIQTALNLARAQNEAAASSSKERPTPIEFVILHNANALSPERREALLAHLSEAAQQPYRSANDTVYIVTVRIARGSGDPAMALDKEFPGALASRLFEPIYFDQLDRKAFRDIARARILDYCAKCRPPKLRVRVHREVYETIAKDVYDANGDIELLHQTVDKTALALLKSAFSDQATAPGTTCELVSDGSSFRLIQRLPGEPKESDAS